MGKHFGYTSCDKLVLEIQNVTGDQGKESLIFQSLPPFPKVVFLFHSPVFGD